MLFCRLKKIIVIAMLGLICSVSHAEWNRSTDHLRVFIGAGLRNINDEVMDTSAWDIAREIGIGVYRDDKAKNIYYGLASFSNNSWDARINQTSQASSRFLQTVTMHNSSSIDLLAYTGRYSGEWSVDIGAGAQLSWVKWLNTILSIDNKLRVVPKVRVSLNRNMSEKSTLFIAFNQAINVYGSLHCDVTNCLKDDGYVNVSDLKLGVSFVMT
ncbi:MAG: hypothetical protein P1U36_07930 [Legionellaceae bacterium]|nr:hypothetical protein [Legionellaceae bacterium]